MNIEDVKTLPQAYKKGYRDAEKTHKLIHPLEIQAAEAKLIDEIFNELCDDGKIARGWVPCCIEDDCDGFCLYHTLKRYEQEIKLSRRIK